MIQVVHKQTQHFVFFYFKLYFTIMSFENIIACRTHKFKKMDDFTDVFYSQQKTSSVYSSGYFNT